MSYLTERQSHLNLDYAAHPTHPPGQISLLSGRNSRRIRISPVRPRLTRTNALCLQRFICTAWFSPVWFAQRCL